MNNFACPTLKRIGTGYLSLEALERGNRWDIQSVRSENAATIWTSLNELTSLMAGSLVLRCSDWTALTLFTSYLF